MILSSGDDGIHSDLTLDINGGEINITKSYEELESAAITINDGTIHDGINVVDNNSETQQTNVTMEQNTQRQNAFNTSGNNNLYINGGYIVVDAEGDSLDIVISI